MLLDTSALVEYFNGTEKGNVVKGFLETENTPCYICPLTIAEISLWCQRNNKDSTFYLNILKKLAYTLDMKEDILIFSGVFYEKIRKINGKISLIDCIIYMTARIHGLQLVTADGDFRYLEGVILL